VSGLAIVTLATGGALTGLAPPVSASSGGTISIAYEDPGTGGNPAMGALLSTASAEFAKQYPGWTIKLDDIRATENPYYIKLDLMSSSSTTAPDVLYEDTFLVNSDVAAGYLAPIDSYLAKWSGWKEFSPAAQAAAKGVDGHIYGVPMGTDTRGLWYNKSLLAKAGITLPWHPKTWADVLSAAEAVKKADPGVTPLNIYAGVSAGEATSMQGFEMLLYGTNNPLYDTKTNKWEMAGAGWQATLNFYKTIYSQGLSLSPQEELGTNISTTIAGQLMPQGKLAIDLDGSWMSGAYWGPKGAYPWPQWSKVIGETAMPTQNGQAGGEVSMSGGWLLSVGSHAPNRQMAFNFISVALDKANSLYFDVNGGQIAVRYDVAASPAYKNSNAAISTMSSFVPFTHFRPAYTAYPKLSDEIQLITGQVMTGQATSAQGAASYNKYLIGLVGQKAVEPAPM
jgi:multiple sugar transport system substrate-binding protein